MINYDYINEYIRKTIKPSSGILKELEDYARDNRIPIIQPEVVSMLVLLGRLLKPFRILEAGTAIGYSAILLSGILAPGGRIDTVERYGLMIETAKGNIKKAGLENSINLIEGDALDVLKCLDKQYDMIFLDAGKGQYPEFLPECKRMLKSGGLLVSDNVLYKGMIASDGLVVRRKKTIVRRMRDFLDSLCRDEDLETSIIPIGDGVALTYKR
ncbi:MAG: O-methyltransferase [Ruminiclostridium sp.]|nr:O-methyltransferase [Ruminiclostridium sp.]